MKKNADDLVRVHILIEKEVHEELMARFNENPGYSKAVRAILKKFLTSINQQTQARPVKPMQELPQ